MSSFKGFTLIELLITIAIMGIVFGIVLTSTSLIRKNSNDTQRQADLRSIQSAIEQYHSDQGFYPALSGGTVFALGQSLTNITGNPTMPAPVLKTYLNKLPDDANVSQHYCYQPQKNSSGGSCDNSSQASYCEYYQLFSKLDNPPASPPPVTNCTGTVAGSGFNLVVTPP